MMLTLATTFFFLSTPAVPHRPTEPVLDHNRVLACILAVEGNPWSREGGGYGFKRITWRQHTTLPFRYASIPLHAQEVAHAHIEWIIRSLKADGLPVTPYSIYACWLHGLEGGELCVQSGKCDRAKRCENLYWSGHEL